jgi:hypothetical protein
MKCAMPIEFVAHMAGVDDEYCLVAGVSERDDGIEHTLLFQAGHEPPDEQDVELGMDTHCVVTTNQATAYGCVRELTIDGDRMQVIIASDALADPGLENAEIRVQLAVDAQSVENLREYRGHILTYGRPDAQPAVLRL